MLYALADTAPTTEVNQGLADLSDTLVLVTILLYAVALFAFAAEAAYGRRTRVAAARIPAMAGSAAAGDARVRDTEPDLGGAVDELQVRVRDAEPDTLAARHPIGRVAMVVTVLGLIAQAGQIISRGLAADRWPWGNMFEFVVAITLCAVATFVYVAVRHRAYYLGAFVMVPVVLLLGIAVRWLYTEAAPLVPALHSPWIAIHVSAAIIATGAFVVSGATTVMYLLADRAELRARAGQAVRGVVAKLPAAEILDRLSHRTIVFAFPLWTFAIIAGAIWADEAWGRFWGWDPKEVWSFITWVVYAGYLHARATAGWRGRKAAVISLIGAAALLFNFFGVNYLFSGLHSYAG
ncbi:c-type cytochrome biogenesis protein CcsB [Allonocardiopsis opalescens]|uniref:Cytochrome c-type biogenesis protein CcsB n=1 Tax=Allonocardiopsis opalescens TaxID=1144618 RepID=A0A2T0Q7V9_9ACTN|nr:c-type cytochrome biogenesis protein CcsB [Allonocardiopsis opalescens]PRX99904.1 cytochrome c-type biogenesis protein CcsB [Allonocardiopsis opalescens]